MMKKAAFTAMLCGLCGSAMADTSQSVWSLATIDDLAFSAQATLEFMEDGRIGGEAPCNRWGAAQTRQEPAFSAEAIFATRRACPDLAEETAFFSALETMTEIVVDDDRLTLSAPDGKTMTFVRLAPDA